jgi:hypothetical protein
MSYGIIDPDHYLAARSLDRASAEGAVGKIAAKPKESRRPPRHHTQRGMTSP